MKRFAFIGVGLACFATACLAQWTTNPPGTNVVTGYTVNTNVSPNQITSNYVFTSVFPRIRPLLAPSVTDTDAIAFINRSMILSQADQVSLQNLVLGLKTNGIWTNLVAFYPFYTLPAYGQSRTYNGGFANSDSLNLVSTNYTIAWFTGCLFDGTGVSSAGHPNSSTNGTGDCSFSPSTFNAPTNNWHIFAWLGSTNLSTTNYYFGTAHNTPTPKTSTYFAGTTTNFIRACLFSSTNQPELVAPFGGGPVLTEFATAGTVSLYAGAGVTNVATASATPLSNSGVDYSLFDISLLSGGTTGKSSQVNFRALSFGYGLTAAQVTNYFAVVQSWENALNRGTP